MLTTWTGRGFPLVLLCALVSSARAEHVAIHYWGPDNTGRPLVVAAAARCAGRDVLDPEQTRERLQQHAPFARKRRDAAKLLAKANALWREVRYEEALPLLSRAGDAAVEGKARVIDPYLLADIYYLQGLVLLSTDVAAAQHSLVQSYRMMPQRPTKDPELSPKIVDVLRRAAAEAQRTAFARPNAEQVAGATRVLEVEQVLLVSIRKDKALLDLVDVARAKRVESVKVSWSEGASDEQIRDELEGAMRRLLPAKGGRGTPITFRRLVPWIVGGVGVVALAAGTGCALLARSREGEAESKAGSTGAELIEYSPEVENIEKQGKRYALMGGVFLGIGGAAVATGAVLYWLLPPKKAKTEEAVSGLRLWPGGVSYSVPLP